MTIFLASFFVMAASDGRHSPQKALRSIGHAKSNHHHKEYAHFVLQLPTGITVVGNSVRLPFLSWLGNKRLYSLGAHRGQGVRSVAQLKASQQFHQPSKQRG